MAYSDNFDLNKTATVTRYTRVNNGFGGVTGTTTTIATIKCAIWQNTASENTYSDRIHNDSSHILACKPLSTIRADDTVTSGSDTYKITQPDDIMGLDELMTIGLELVK